MMISCYYLEDQARVIDLLLAYRAAATVYAYPTVWRLRLLWSSRVWEPVQDVRLWEDAAGRVIGFALLWRRRRESPYLALEWVIHPTLATEALVDAMLAWAVARVQTITVEQTASRTLYANALNLPLHFDAAFERHGFTPLPPDPEQFNVYLTRSLQTSLSEPALPPGYILRPLASVDELEAYAAMSGFAAVDPHHRRELFASDEYAYRVVVAPDGEFVAYCEVSICREEWARSGRRVGWIDYVETRPEQQRRGLGRAVLLAGLRQLQEWGAETAMLITVNTNAPALGLYDATGFVRMDVSEMPGYERLIRFEPSSVSPVGEIQP
ncbi:MAG TPA: GNAT family N-acetyltransferase [Anaerolineae bacterium]|nr:GNAT family N-acetyltransferase [Anaerolineae bacterium]